MWNDIVINYWAVLVGGVIWMVTGMFWYSPMGFGNAWMRLSGHTPDDANKDQVGKLYLWQFIAALIVSYILAHFVRVAGAITWQDGAVVGFWAWLGFFAAGSAGVYLFPPKPLALFAFDKGYQLLNLLITAALLAVWR